MRLTALFRYALIAAGLSLFFTAHAAQLTAGKDYAPVRVPQPTESGSKVEVMEFFWYGCPHCYNLQPALEAWLKRKPADVEFRRIPAVFQDSWVPLTRAYYTIEAMGLVDKLHQEVFTALHKQRVRLQDDQPRSQPSPLAMQAFRHLFECLPLQRPVAQVVWPGADLACHRDHWALRPKSRPLPALRDSPQQLEPRQWVLPLL